MDIGQALAWGRQNLSGQSEYPARDAAVLLAHVLDCSTSDLYLHPERLISQAQFESYSSLIARRALKEPIAYITGYKEFMGLEFKVNERVLIPRPETEILVESCLSVIDDMLSEPRSRPIAIDDMLREPPTRPVTVVDLCCGSGAVGLSILRLMTEAFAQADGAARGVSPRAKVILTDISPDALNVAKQNAEMLGVLAQVEFLLGDGFEPLTQHGLQGKVDLIASNPPYIATGVIPSLDDEVKCYEPRLALDGGNDGTRFIEQIIRQAPSMLAPGGYLIMEIGHDQADKCRHLLATAEQGEGAFQGPKGTSPWQDWRFVEDYAGIERILVARASESAGEPVNRQ